MSNPWRQHPKLMGRFHPEAPDDVQVIVHDGGPRASKTSPEEVWVTVTGVSDDDIFTGRVLNRPHQLKTVQQGLEIRFVVPAGEHLLMVTDRYLAERNNWRITGCSKCGLDELFDAPSDLIRAVFPDLPDGAITEKFTSFCGVCGGVQLVACEDLEAALQSLSGNSQAARGQRKWWEFWK